MPDLCVFRLEFENNIAIFEIRICLSAKFCEETKLAKFGTKNALFRYL